MKFKRYILPTIIVVLFNACATYKAQYKNKNHQSSFPANKEITHSFFLIGDAGNSPLGEKSKALQLFQSELDNAPENSTALFLGDNIYPKGFPEKGNENRDFAIHQLNVQTETVSNFKGKSIFIPGNHDWYSGLAGLKRQEKYIEEKLGKNTFLPENGCPIEKVNINDSTVLIVVDSHWYVTNWNKHPTINDDCEIKTREQFFGEFESLIKKARGKTTIVAIHHPLYTNGPHGGHFSAEKHLKPLPGLGSLKNLLRKTSGVSNADLMNKHYQYLKKRMSRLSQENEKVIFVSGHEHSLQYIAEDNITQIVSGAGVKTNGTKLVEGQFSFGEYGFARLDVFSDGSSYVRFYTAPTKDIPFETEVFPATKNNIKTDFNPNFPSTVSASIYNEEETKKSKLHNWLWGERYRKDYSKKVLAPTVNLDTLFGGLTPIRKGGGQQSKSLRLKDSLGREFIMRALRKNASQFIQASAFKENYVKEDFENTLTEKFVLDIFSGSQPYAPFTIGPLSDAANIYHSNPKLYYIPKQKALKAFNSDFGDELYMIEERVSTSQRGTKSFGLPDEIISTHDLLQKLRKSSKHVIDEETYIRARLFDMLIGDWDRHQDQWRWAAFKEENKTIYKPIPRDRDQAFSIMDEGVVLGTASKIVPATKKLRSYSEDLKSPKWASASAYPLDIALINRSSKNVWDAQVNYIVKNLTDNVIDTAFKNYPSEIDQETISEIRKKLIGRRRNLQKIADAYYKHINKHVVIKGTDKEDLFTIERLNDDKTKVTVRNMKKDKVYHERTYSCQENKEIWIYGLDDKDVFEVFGEAKKLIPIRLVGGQNNDTYKITNHKKITIYDYKSKKNTVETKGKKRLIDDYDTNIYDYRKSTNSSNQLIPLIGFNPDDGFKIGVTNITTLYGFERNPFSSIHKLSAAYFFATNGYQIGYSGEFANIIKKWNLGIDTKLTSPNYSINFFGFGNESINFNDIDDDQFDLDFNRIKISEFKFAPSLVWKSNLDATFKTSVVYENIEVEKTDGRFIADLDDITEDSQNFLGAEIEYSFVNKDYNAFPTLGLEFHFTTGYKTNLNSSNGFAYLKPSFTIDHKITTKGNLVLASKIGSHINFNNDFEFYQGASIGATEGLRGYRKQRFTGKDSFYQTTDLRLVVAKMKTNLAPITIGLYGGFDYGKVWESSNNTNKWNNSYGGGLFINTAKVLVGNISVFSSDEGLRFAFKAGFGF